MNAIVSPELDAIAEFGEFFAPSTSDFVDGLVAEYRARRSQIEQVAALFEGDIGGVVHYFIEGNRCVDGSRYSSMSAEKIFGARGAVAALNADFWQRALMKTDVYDYMPQARRDEWNNAIREMKAPEFEEESVRATLQELMNSRAKFFAERVDGIFRALSREHVTNRPEGFSKRMILRWVTSSFGTTNHSECGYINDLRAVIAKFMGRDEPKWNATNAVVDSARHSPGEWVTLDGGALRLRVYKKGTGHLEVHPDMAWRLNAILASMYPLAIPSQFRSPPKARPKDVPLMQRPLPFAVIELLTRMKPAVNYVKTEDWRRPYLSHDIPNTLQFGLHDAESKAAMSEAVRVLETMGGVRQPKGHFLFPYDPSDVLREVVASGCIPDRQAYQFYPTPESVAKVAVEMADIGHDHECLEPSAGVGGLADHMPKDRTTCVEVAAMHCRVLEAKGFGAVVEGDFLKWAAGTGKTFDRVLMNPPFSDGRWNAHLDAAARLVRPGGRLVAILPASARGKYDRILPGFDCQWSGTIANEFAGTSVAVVILAATRAP